MAVAVKNRSQDEESNVLSAPRSGRSARGETNCSVIPEGCLVMTDPAMLAHGRYYVDGKWVALKKEEIELFEWCKWISEETDDPHVRVAGRSLHDVQTAKDNILSALGIRNKQVTMKLNVSYTHHSHIIGEGGQTITNVRKQTGCHIHFPDSNRTGSEMKSNQVSITGSIEGVEKARSRVRELVPLVFCFELPVLGSIQTYPDVSSPYIQQISETYKVHVSYKTRSRLHATLVIVKGCEWEVESVKDATLLLINHMCGKVASQVPVQMTMEISPHHHPIVLGPQSQYLKAIMENTQTQIMFPDAQDPNIPVLKKSNVTITGQINNVYLARQQLMGSLPINLTFSLTEENTAIDSERINQISEALDVSISTRHCPKQNNLTVIIKGVERNTSNIYEARRILLNLEEKIEACIPETYKIPNPPKIFDRNEISDINSTRALPNIVAGEVPNFPGIPIQEHSQLIVPPMYSQLWGSQLPPGLMSITWGQMMMPPQQQQQPPQQQPLIIQRPRPASTATNRDTSTNSSGYGSQMSFNQYNNVSGSPISENNGLSALSSLSSNASSLSTPAVSPRNLSPTMQGLDLQLSVDLSKLMKASPEWSDRRSIGFDANMQQNLTHGDYDQKKYLAVKAMQNLPNSNEVRVPTSAWAGYGLSLTSPPGVFTEQKDFLTKPSNMFDTDPWKGSTEVSSPNFPIEKEQPNFLSSSNAVDFVPSGILQNMQKCDTDLPTLLAALGLEKYIQLFKSQEIDMSSFQLFNDTNLKEIGVSAYGARHKMLLAIAELKKRRSPVISAAPGAERKRSRGWPNNE
ncbi:UNVERIFIED_CONTAM: hypothetical protein PYX00_000715 [Menopon gallinae]|uniref:SAM domain-containing protein n=1 Tax=Menopon gallinae TaxID=328185 RepID=A0AAW2IBG2_9NEOP